MYKKNHFALTKYFHFAATLPFCVVILSGIFLSAVHEQDPKFASEYFPDDGFRQTIILYLAFSLMIAVASFTLFFNSYKKCSDHFVLSLLSWMLLPCVLLAVAFYRFLSSVDTFSYNTGSNQTLDYFFVFIVFAHLVALAISFLQFRRTLLRVAELNK